MLAATRSGVMPVSALRANASGTRFSFATISNASRASVRA